MFVYAVALWWLDRYEKEPLHLLLFAVLWGAVPSVVLSIVLELLVGVPILAFARNQLVFELLGSVLTAPVIEEFAKGIALVTLFLFSRLELDSPLDGLIYGGMVGFGFAAVENFFYLLAAHVDGGLSGAFDLAILRAGVFGLNHAMYTAFTGLGLALALEVRAGWLKLLLPVVGFGASVFTHAYHNTQATFWGYTPGNTALYYAIIVDLGGVFFLLVIAAWARLLERERIQRFLQLYAPGRLTLPGHQVLLSPLRRSGARWSALLAGDLTRWRVLGRYHRLVSEAAFCWHRANRGDAKAAHKMLLMESKLRAAQEHLGGASSDVGAPKLERE
jgi:RsiW-degrading membrane proteinase PrsW (M82 family)